MYPEHVGCLPCSSPATLATSKAPERLIDNLLILNIMWLIVEEGSEALKHTVVKVQQVPFIATLQNGMFAGSADQLSPVRPVV
jgi:hypothetical protein